MRVPAPGEPAFERAVDEIQLEQQRRELAIQEQQPKPEPMLTNNPAAARQRNPRQLLGG